MKTKSIRYNFFVSITAVLVVSVLAMGLIQTWLSIGYLNNEKARMLDRVAQGLAGNAHGNGKSLKETPASIMKFMAEMADASVFVVSLDGTVRYSAGKNAPPPGVQLPKTVMAQFEGKDAFRDMGMLDGQFNTVHHISGCTIKAAGQSALGYVFAAADAGVARLYLLDTFSTIAISALLVLLAGSLLAFALSSRTIMSIRRVSLVARRFAEGDYGARAPVEGDDEMAQLAVTFNEMAHSFQSVDISRRSFMGNIAHELRTPMTTIKGFIDGMLDGTIKVEQRDKYLAVVSDEVGRLARLTKNMLDISRLEAGEYVPQNEAFDIWRPVASVFIGAEKRLEEKKIQVDGLSGQQAAPVWADEDFVHQVLYNLADNAIKFSDDGGRVSVAVSSVKGVVTTRVRNTGQGMPEDQMGHVFDRFYKADKSRGLNTSGAGLGLHISKVLVGLMGGRIWAEGRQGEYAEFVFTLPAYTPPKKAPWKEGQKRQ